MALAIAIVVAVVFSPFLFGNAALMMSAGDAPSLYDTGARPEPSAGLAPRELDPGAPAWTIEPWLAIEHRIAFAEGRLPFWDPDNGYGQPLAAAMQSQPFYPLTTALALAPSPRAYAWWIAARLFVAGLFAALYLLLFTSRLGAFVGALATMLTGYFLVYLNMPHVSVEVILPMLLWATELLARRITPLRVAAVAVAAALVYLGGMPESALLVLTVGFLYGLVRAFTVGQARPARLVAAIVAAHLLGIALGAIQIFPFAEFAGNSFNEHDPKMAGSIVGLVADGGWHFALLTEFVPRVFGPLWNSILTNGSGFNGTRGFFGCTTFFLAAIAVVAVLRRRGALTPVVLFLTFIVAFAIAKRFGSPLVEWLGLVPPFTLVNFPKYGEAVAGVSAGLLAGFGADFVWKRQAGPRTAWAAFAATLFVVTYFVATTTDDINPRVTGSFWYTLALDIGLGALIATGVLVALILASEGRVRRLAGWALCAVVVAEPLIGYIVPTIWRSPPAIAANPYAGAPYLEWLQLRVKSSNERTFGIRGMLFPNWAGVFGLGDPGALDALYPERFLRFVDAFISQSPAPSEDQFDRFTGMRPIAFDTPLVRRWLALSSIGYIVTPATAGPGDPLSRSLPLVYSGPGVSIFRVAGSLPRVALFHVVHEAASFDAALGELTAATFDVHRDLVVEGAAPTVASETSGDRVSVTAARSDALDVDVDAAGAGVLMQNDTWYPGWIAIVDGTTVPLLRVDGLFRGVLVPKGHHHVEIVYRSRVAAWGSATTLGGLLLLIGLCLGTRLARPRSELANADSQQLR